MSIVQAALTQLTQDLRNYQTLSHEAQLEIIEKAYLLLGKPFLEGLTYIERTPEDLIIKETPTFVSVSLKSQKELLFVNKQTAIGVECICEVAWARKTSQSNQLMCKHEAMYMLWKYCFPEYAHYSSRAVNKDQDPN